MTPLTHAAVGAAISQRLGKGSRIATIAGCCAALASHYALDAIPHFEQGVVVGRGGLDALRIFVLGHRFNISPVIPLGIIGVLFGLFLMRRKAEAGRIWIILAIWVGLGGYTLSWWRVLTAAAALGFAAWKCKERISSIAVFGGMLAVAPDLLDFRKARAIHDYFHYHVDWATRLYLAASNAPAPKGFFNRIQNPYFLTGYALELAVEGAIFFGALYLLSRNRAADAPERVEDAAGASVELTGKV